MTGSIYELVELCRRERYLLMFTFAGGDATDGPQWTATVSGGPIPVDAIGSTMNEAAVVALDKLPRRIGGGS